MGKKKLIVLLLLSPFVLTLLIVLVYPPFVLVIADILVIKIKGEMIITDISLTENNMIVEIERKGAINNFWDYPRLRYTNIPISLSFPVRSSKLIESGVLAIEPGVFIMEEEWHGEHESKIRFTMDLTGITRVVYDENEEHPDLSNILYINEEASLIFPLSGRNAMIGAIIFIEEDKVHILEQRFHFR